MGYHNIIYLHSLFLCLLCLCLLTSNVDNHRYKRGNKLPILFKGNVNRDEGMDSSKLGLK